MGARWQDQPAPASVQENKAIGPFWTARRSSTATRQLSRYAL